MGIDVWNVGTLIDLSGLHASRWRGNTVVYPRKNRVLVVHITHGKPVLSDTSHMVDSQPPIRIDIWSDIACPWCYIGKRRLEAGIRQYQESVSEPREVHIVYHSYELQPGAPKTSDASAAQQFSDMKGMPVEQAEQMFAQVTDVAKGEGLTYRFDLLKMTSTRLAHELLHYAHFVGKQAEMKERLLRAHFEEGVNVSDADELVRLATEVGLDAKSTRDALSTHAYGSAVNDDIHTASQIGVQGVPFFVLNSKYSIGGAQDPSVFAQALTQVHEEDDA